jgi:AraC-like DNA-binding protein
LIECLSAGPVLEDAPAARRHADIMARFEDTLQAHPNRVLSLAEICVAVGTSERTLRACCGAHLGMGPSRWVRMRRLQLTYRALGSADPNEPNVSQVARRYGFTDLSRFAAAYRALFGELPSATLRRR